MPQIIDQFGHKRCPKKRKDGDYKLLYEFYQKHFVVHELSALKNSSSTHACYNPDGLFWLNLYQRFICSFFFWTNHVNQNVLDRYMCINGKDVHSGLRRWQNPFAHSTKLKTNWAFWVLFDIFWAYLSFKRFSKHERLP